MVQLRIFVNFRNALKPFSDDEKGRLFDAMLAYAEDKTVLPLPGNERFIWDWVKETLDAQHESYEAKCSNMSKARANNPCNNDSLLGNKDQMIGEDNLSLSNFDVQEQEQVQVKVQEQVQDKKRYSKEKKPAKKRVSNFPERQVTDEDFKDLFLDLNTSEESEIQKAFNEATKKLTDAWTLKA